MGVFSIENYIFQHIVCSLKKANNMFTQFYLKTLWKNTVANQAYIKKPMALVFFWQKRRQILKNSKRTNQIFLFSVNTVISAAQDRWPVDLRAECIYNHLFKSVPETKRLSKKSFDKVLQEKEESYQQAVMIFFKEVKTCFFHTFPKGQSNSQLRRIFFDAALSFLQDPKLQKAAIRCAQRKSKSQHLATHKITDIKRMFYVLEKKDIEKKSIFKKVA